LAEKKTLSPLGGSSNPELSSWNTTVQEKGSPAPSIPSWATTDTSKVHDTRNIKTLPPTYRGCIVWLSV